MADFYHVYILVSELHPGRHYTGLTEDLQRRVNAHNSGRLPAVCPGDVGGTVLGIPAAPGRSAQQRLPRAGRYLVGNNIVLNRFIMVNNINDEALLSVVAEWLEETELLGLVPLWLANIRSALIPGG